MRAKRELNSALKELESLFVDVVDDVKKQTFYGILNKVKTSINVLLSSRKNSEDNPKNVKDFALSFSVFIQL